MFFDAFMNAIGHHPEDPALNGLLLRRQEGIEQRAVPTQGVYRLLLSRADALLLAGDAHGARTHLDAAEQISHALGHRPSQRMGVTLRRCRAAASQGRLDETRALVRRALLDSERPMYIADLVVADPVFALLHGAPEWAPVVAVQHGAALPEDWQ